jgi:hypothetical protein
MVLLRVAWVALGAWAGVMLMVLLLHLLPPSVGRYLEETELSWGEFLIPAFALLWLLSVTAGAILFSWLWRRWFSRRASKR